jgi:anti-sigma regulatory factor (Ser/Thr protein kinase)
MSMSKIFPQLQMAIGHEEFSHAGDLLNRFLKRYAIPPNAIYNADLVLEEMVGNIIRHGKATGKIGVSVRIGSEGLLITIKDNGPPFDPTKFPDPEIPHNAAKAPVGGLGIHMVRSVTTEMRYQRIGDRNRLEIRIGMDDGPNN